MVSGADAALGAVVDLLRCPLCAAAFDVVVRSLRCRRGHVFDISRQGYVNLTGAAQPAHADTSAMVSARADLLRSGRYAALSDALLACVPPDVSSVLDVGTGTGHYAAALLDAHPAARCLGLDVSVAACRRAARAHRRLAVATADAWAGLPVADGCVDLVLSVFSPRNADEFARVLRPAGQLITVTPASDHLTELRAALGLLGVEDDKLGRLAEVFGRVGLTQLDQRTVRRHDPWAMGDATNAVLMGPNAFHNSAEAIRDAVARLTWPRPVTIACVITRWGR